MDIDLGQILKASLVPDGTLGSVIYQLEESIPPCRRDLAYALANIRRVEQKFKQIREQISRLDRTIAATKDYSGQTQILVSDRLINIQAISNLTKEYKSLTQRALTLRTKISETESQIQQIQTKRQNQKIQAQKTQRRKYYYMALGVIDANFLINVIEYPVIQEAIAQHSQLTVDVRIRFKPIEIAAYTLNRLPSMYVHTMESYEQQSQIISSQMKLKITDSVKRSIQYLRMGDPLYDTTSVPDEVFYEPSGLLGCLCLIFNRNDLRWSDVPKLLLKIKERRSPDSQVPVKLSETYTSPTGYVRQSQVSHVQKYLQRSKVRKGGDEDQKSPELAKQIEDKFLEYYTLRGKLKYINLLEKLIVGQALFMMIDIFDESSNYAEIIAHALNHLTPMYITTERGINQMCKNFFENQAEFANAQLSKSSASVLGYKKGKPLFFNQFNFEYQVAMPEIAKILDQRRLTPENLIDAIREFVAQAS